MSEGPETQRPAGYLLLRDRHALQCLPNPIESFVGPGTRRTNATQERTQEIYPKSYWPGGSDFDHLEFALKREGVHLQLLRTLLPRLPGDALTAYIHSKLTTA